MADVKWIKITTDVFDDEKIILIESLPDAYAIITVWFKLLCLAGKQNNSGVFTMGQMPYTDKMLATIFRMKETTVTMALQTFEQFGMVEIINGVITIPNWDKHQSLDAYEKKKERDRLYQQERRNRQKLLASGKSSDKSSDVGVSEEDKEKDIDKDKEKDKKERFSFEQIKDLYNDICISFPRLMVLSDTRKKSIKARLNKYTLEQFKEVFKKAEASDFLKGDNSRNWQANFDWMIKDSNFAKVLEGNYDNKTAKSKKANWASYDLEAFERMLNRDDPPTAANDENIRARAEALQQELAGKK